MMLTRGGGGDELEVGTGAGGLRIFAGERDVVNSGIPIGKCVTVLSFVKKESG